MKEQDFVQDFKKLMVLTAIMMSISVISKMISQIKVPLLKAVQIYRVKDFEKSWDKMKQSCGYGYSSKKMRRYNLFRLKMYFKNYFVRICTCSQTCCPRDLLLKFYNFQIITLKHTSSCVLINWTLTNIMQTLER